MTQAKTIYLATWDHKHGQDISAHTTDEGAFQQCVAWMRETLEEWVDYHSSDEEAYYSSLSDSDLFDSWPEITGDNEFMSVQDLQLHEVAVQQANVEGSVDTAHIGA